MSDRILTTFEQPPHAYPTDIVVPAEVAEVYGTSARSLECNDIKNYPMISWACGVCGGLAEVRLGCLLHLRTSAEIGEGKQWVV
jgi:hypothetical protein